MFCRSYWSRLPTYGSALVTSLFEPVFPALGTTCSYLSIAIYKYRCNNRFYFFLPYLVVCEKIRFCFIFFFVTFLLFFCLFYLTTRATIAKIRQATPKGLENKVLLLLSSNILKDLAMEYANANTIPNSAI